MSNCSSRLSITKDNTRHLIERHDGDDIMREWQAVQQRQFVLDFETIN